MSNAPGLEIALAAMIVRTLLQFESSVRAEANGMSADGKSLLGLLALAAACGTEVKFTATGHDAAPALKAVKHLLAAQLQLPRPSRARLSISLSCRQQLPLTINALQKY
jgi:phosphotransferase system HPr (HPr) family protein